MEDAELAALDERLSRIQSAWLSRYALGFFMGKTESRRPLNQLNITLMQANHALHVRLQYPPVDSQLSLQDIGPDLAGPWKAWVERMNHESAIFAMPVPAWVDHEGPGWEVPTWWGQNPQDVMFSAHEDPMFEIRATIWAYRLQHVFNAVPSGWTLLLRHLAPPKPALAWALLAEPGQSYAAPTQRTWALQQGLLAEASLTAPGSVQAVLGPLVHTWSQEISQLSPASRDRLLPAPGGERRWTSEQRQDWALRYLSARDRAQHDRYKLAMALQADAGEGGGRTRL